MRATEVLAANSASFQASTQLDRHPITRSINQTDAIGLIIALATEYCARCNDVYHPSPLYRQPFRKFCLRGTRLYLAALGRSTDFVAPVLRHTGGQIPNQFGKSRKSVLRPVAAPPGFRVLCGFERRNATPISPLRRRVPRLPVNEPALDLQRLLFPL